MSYNTRRTGSGGGFAPSPNAVGQRRPQQQSSQGPQQANYQQQGQAQNKPPQGQQQPQAQRIQQQQQQQSAQNVGYRTQPVQKPQQQPPPVVQQQPPPPVQQQQQQIPQQQPIQGAGKMMVQSVTLKKEEVAPVQPPVQSMDTDQDASGTQPTQRRKPAWLTKDKLPKRERQRRRNLRLRRILQPKNALMILNELVKSATFNVTELPTPVNGCLFEATVMVHDVELKAIGRSKHSAKAAAAEVALRHVIKYKKIQEIKQEESNGGAPETEEMEVTEEDINVPIPWQHIASFALYKLFSSWGEDPDKVRQEFVPPKSVEPKPPKPLPSNAAEMNPIQLLNQMKSNVQYEEIGKSGTPPHSLFTMKCVVDADNYIGTGPNKKLAKKMAAFAACAKIYGIQYPPEIYPL